MCTVSWIHQGSGYQLLCNRDEKRTRGPASTPRLLTRDNVRFVAPIDGDFGGTWVAVNEFGLSLVLLNRAPSSAAKLSRGLLPMNLIPSPTLSEIAEHITTTDLSDFAAFTLAAFQPSLPAALFHWDGRKLTADLGGDQHVPLVSSSFDPERVEWERRAEFGRLRDWCGGIRVGNLLAFHASHQPERGPYSPCMHREDAETVSFTWVTVNAAEVSLYYAPGAPCCSLAGESRTLPLRKEPPAALRNGTIPACRSLMHR
jgi:Transport and Golgi organisation 2